jgi:hypothetical protein
MTTERSTPGQLYRAVTFTSNVDGHGLRYEDAGISEGDVERLRTDVERLRSELAEALATKPRGVE